jgi:hypothetical protein
MSPKKSASTQELHNGGLNPALFPMFLADPRHPAIRKTGGDPPIPIGPTLPTNGRGSGATGFGLPNPSVPSDACRHGLGFRQASRAERERLEKLT